MKGVTVVYLRKGTSICSIFHASFHWLIILKDGVFMDENSANSGWTSGCHPPTLELSLPTLLAWIVVAPFAAGLLYPPFDLSQSSGRGGGGCPSFGSEIQLSHMQGVMRSPPGPVLSSFPLCRHPSSEFEEFY